MLGHDRGGFKTILAAEAVAISLRSRSAPERGRAIVQAKIRQPLAAVDVTSRVAYKPSKWIRKYCGVERVLSFLRRAQTPAASQQ